MEKGQGTIEYLIIIAVIIVISLVVATFTITFSSDSDISVKSDTISGKIGHGSISVSEAIFDENGDGVIVFQNVGSETITIDKISSGGKESTFDTILSFGQQGKVSGNQLSDVCLCNVGEKTKTCELVVTYTQNGVAKKAYQKTVVNCVVDVNYASVLGHTSNPTLKISVVTPEGQIDYNNSISSNGVEFSYSVDGNASYCSLYVDDALKQTDSSYPFGSFSVDLNLGSHSWFVNCASAYTDKNSSTKNFTLNTGIHLPDYFFYKDGWPSSTIKKISSTTGALLDTYDVTPIGAYHCFSLDPDRNVLWVAEQGSTYVTRLDSTDGTFLSSADVGSENCTDLYEILLNSSGKGFVNAGWQGRGTCELSSAGAYDEKHSYTSAVDEMSALILDNEGLVWTGEQDNWGDQPTLTIEAINPATEEIVHTFEVDCYNQESQIDYVNWTAFTFDSLGYLWMGCGPSNKVYKYSKDGTKLFDQNIAAVRIITDQQGGVYLTTSGSDANLIKINSYTNSIDWNIDLGHSDEITHLFFEPYLTSGYLIVGRDNESGYIDKYNAENGAFVGQWTSGNPKNGFCCAGTTTADPNGFYYSAIVKGYK